MKKVIHILIIGILIFSCTKEVKPSQENLQAIIDSEKFEITIDIVSGSIAGSHTDEMIIQLDGNKLKSTSMFHDINKEMSDPEIDSLKSILKKLATSHNPDKVLLKSGSCTTHDENYLIENDSIRIELKPRMNNYLFHKITELVE